MPAEVKTSGLVSEAFCFGGSQMPSQEKKEKVKEIKKWFDSSDSLLVLEYKGLTVAEANDLRVRLKEMDSELRVLKNTLTRIAVADTPSAGIAPLLDGPIAVVFMRAEAGPVARSIREFAKGRKEFALRGGLLEGRVLDAGQVEAFAMLPGREVLLAQMLGVVQAPLARFAGVITAPAKKMLGLFKALADKVAAEAPAPAGAPEVVAEAPPEAAAQAAEPEEATTEPEETAAQAEEETPQAGGEPAPEADDVSAGGGEPSEEEDEEQDRAGEAPAGQD